MFLRPYRPVSRKHYVSSWAKIVASRRIASAKMRLKIFFIRSMIAHYLALHRKFDGATSTPSEGGGHTFESCRVRHCNQKLLWYLRGSRVFPSCRWTLIDRLGKIGARLPPGSESRFLQNSTVYETLGSPSLLPRRPLKSTEVGRRPMPPRRSQIVNLKHLVRSRLPSHRASVPSTRDHLSLLVGSRRYMTVLKTGAPRTGGPYHASVGNCVSGFAKPRMNGKPGADLTAEAKDDP